MLSVRTTVDWLPTWRFQPTRKITPPPTAAATRPTPHHSRARSALIALRGPGRGLAEQDPAAHHLGEQVGAGERGEALHRQVAGAVHLEDEGALLGGDPHVADLLQVV